MKQIWTRVVAGAAALVCAGAANAYVIDFESVDTVAAPFAPLLRDGDAVLQGDYFVQTLDANNPGPDFNGSLVGQLVNGSDPSTCLDGSCPAGNPTNYLAALNNAIFYIAGADTIDLVSFEAAFLPPAGVALPSTTVALLGIEADRDDGTYAIGIFGLDGPNTGSGTTSFATYAASDATIIGGSGTLTSGKVVDLFVYAYYCGTSSNCTPFSGNKAQFAIDNITVNVPEPAEWLSMAVGLGALGGIVRRRRPL